jgi:hypothetical protein
MTNRSLRELSFNGPIPVGWMGPLLPLLGAVAAAEGELLASSGQLCLLI